ncbi:ribonucleotide reductase inhibitor-domain-containing protein [Annulohypoxylon truncatum]|uniref:ribonucleotide reductase inhibitor-domain-containing protein n=1 Tax=Annulohypoxylon truncatum TaxID=327061 RepID=UPI00200884CA|nr:ribonucleotide reductase inhibitor-domain-containing protein [Annulohypoxylon truncatum]KAI1211899.1 ribonucleotide reductase inhibitor-domain-containing protein [Annulohypoxylon truncatum]
MSAPRTKRQFAGAASDPAQRHITSFFSSSASPLLPSSSSQHLDVPPSPPYINSPPLPATVQANLLSVGMRVRKSVPEGYKTGNYSAFALFDENVTANPQAYGGTMGEGRSRANAISTPRELLPFCGIHKVGGLDTQPEHTSPFILPPSSSSYSSSYIPTSAPFTTHQPLLSINGLPLDDAMTDDDDVPGLTSSQDSLDSVAPPASPSNTRSTRKRSYTEDEEPEAPSTPGRLSVASFDFNVWRDGLVDGEVSPRSHYLPFSSAPAPAPASESSYNGRAIAVPRKMRARSGGGGAKAAAVVSRGRDNVVVFGDGDADVDVDANDFGEADFLVRTGEWEVEMSDA